MAASACSKVVASTATYPHEVIRSHMHIRGIASFSGLREICSNVCPLLALKPLFQVVKNEKHCKWRLLATRGVSKQERCWHHTILGQPECLSDH